MPRLGVQRAFLACELPKKPSRCGGFSPTAGATITRGAAARWTTSGHTVSEMTTMNQPTGESLPSRKQLIDLLNEDLSREYQAIIAYVVYSQVLKGAAYMKIAEELEAHAKEELQHALLVAKQIDYLGGMPTVTPQPVKVSDSAEEMLRFDLQNESETIRHYRQRVRQCETLGEYAIAENIRGILVQEQEHQLDLATALGVDVPDVTTPEERA